ncbi:NAD(P)-dependent oxidoreductase [uncultured Tateyamaria sp.]|uniref:NAD-dependent epimerase/dehydratase family protein n=1 Tax=uncultured Tateyamaria sp. TaxID=455651 RepID=UPI00261010E9|nr:NAD(P)-dependent oxidoreductase [uncultured Tateyamaria sp.]
MLPFKPDVPDALSAHTLCVTGHGGYVGRHLVAALIDAGHRPFLIGRPQVEQTPIAGADMARPWTNAADLGAQLANLTQPIILSIAGHFVSRHSATDIPALVAGNLEFPLTIFEAACHAGQARIVNIGTSWEYSDKGAATPANLYAELKAANAAALSYYARTETCAGINLKLNDTFGGDDTRGKLLGAMRAAWRDGREMALRARAQPINLLYISDVIEGILAAAARTASLTQGTVETAFLLHDETTTVGAVADRVAQVAPAFACRFEDTRPDTPGLRGIWPDAPRLAGWSSRVPLDDGLRAYFSRKDT